MKISQLLREDEESLESYIKKIHELCKQQGCTKAFYNFLNRHALTHTTHRGRSNHQDHGVFEVKVRSKPTSTPMIFHKAYDALYQEKFGFPYRSASLFTYPTIIKGIQQKTKEDMLYIIPPDDAKYAAGGQAERSDFFARFSNINREGVSEFFDYILDDGAIQYEDTNDLYEIEGMVKSALSPSLHAYISIETEEELLNTIEEKVKQYFDFSKYRNTYKEMCLKPLYEFIKKDIATIREYNDYADISPGDEPEIMIQAKKCVYIQQTDFVIFLKRYANQTGKSVEEIFEDMKKWIR